MNADYWQMSIQHRLRTCWVVARLRGSESRQKRWRRYLLARRGTSYHNRQPQSRLPHALQFVTDVHVRDSSIPKHESNTYSMKRKGKARRLIFSSLAILYLYSQAIHLSAHLAVHPLDMPLDSHQSRRDHERKDDRVPRDCCRRPMEIKDLL